MPFPARRLLALLILCLAATSFGQTYTSVLVFGDSLSDTGNVANLTEANFLVRVPGPAFDYTDGRFTDGTDTTPAATKYTGTWIEQLAATFAAKPAVKASLDGGTNYAYGGAVTGLGTTPLNLAPNVTVNVKNVAQQVTDYLAAHPTVAANTLVVVWGGANDVINATAATQLTAAVTAELTAIQQLIAAGATDILIANVPPIGAIPRFNGDATLSAEFNAASQAFNAGLAAGITALPAANPGKTLNIKAFDIYSLFTAAIASPSANGLTNVTTKSQASVTVDPDTYLFWDDLHPTTAGHHLIAVAAAALVTPPAPSITAALSPTSLTVASGASGTSTVTVTPNNGYSGAVTLACSGLPANASCGLSPASLTFTSSASSAQTSKLTISTNSKTNAASAAFLLLPLAGLGTLFALRRRGFHPGLLLLVFVFSSAGFVGLSGCGDSGKKTPAGTYTVPVTVTPASGTATTLSLSLVVQ